MVYGMAVPSIYGAWPPQIFFTATSYQRKKENKRDLAFRRFSLLFLSFGSFLFFFVFILLLLRA